MTTISGIIALVSGLVFIISLIAGTMPRSVKVGEVYAHVNPGRSEDPNKPLRPFVQIYTIEEVKDGQARKRIRSVDINGLVQEYDVWDMAYGMGRHDTQIAR